MIVHCKKIVNFCQMNVNETIISIELKQRKTKYRQRLTEWT